MASSDCLNNILEKQLEKYENNSMDFRLYKKLRKHQHQVTGPLSTEGMQAAANLWIMRI